MFAYDMVVPTPIGQFRAAVLMEFANQLISKLSCFTMAGRLKKRKVKFSRNNSVIQ
jgi:hypothetical protein